MTETKHKHDDNSNNNNNDNNNVENFVRRNTRTIVKQSEQNPSSSTSNIPRTYKCKDCDKEFASFQALGGHRAGHRAKPDTPGESSGVASSKKKLHKCKICHKGFEIGQSLGGHMRKHWHEKIKNGDQGVNSGAVSSPSSSTSSKSSVLSCSDRKKGLEYDLNLTPCENEGVNSQVKLKPGLSSKDE